jgi:hypothetical protein
MPEYRKTPTLAGDFEWRLPERIALAILLLVLLLFVGQNVLAILDVYNFHEELRILYHLDPLRTNGKDYAGQFLSQFPQPFLYLFLTKSALAAGVDLITFHKFLGIFCGMLLLAGAAVSGSRIGGIPGAVVVALFIAAQPIYQYQLSSATPHAFAFPFLIWALVCLLFDKFYWLAGLTVLSGILYPPMSPILGMILAWQFVIIRKGLTGDNPDRLFDVIVVGITAAISIALLYLQLTPIEGYGAALAPGQDAETYPENGPKGRYFPGVFNPLRFVLYAAMDQLPENLPVLLIIFSPICVVAIAALGLYYSRRQATIFQAFIAFIVPGVVFCILMTTLRPYLAYRYLLYPLFTILPLLFIGGLFILCHRYRAFLRYPVVVIMALLLPLFFATNSSRDNRSVAPLKLDESSNALMVYLRQLPADSLIAAWPGEAKTSLIPYVAGRPLFVNFKAHYPNYEGHIINMRTRMFDLIDAYLASDLQPLVDLHCRWQVDYLIVDKMHFSGNGVSLRYFAPFDKRVEAVLGTVEKQNLILRNPPADAVVFSSGKYRVLDMALLSREIGCLEGR